jgi:asparagine synthase (glutamine-hydrolysing)
MCGIAGILGSTHLISESSIISMTQTMVHRGPDGSGHWLSEDGLVALGHRRLSIIDLSEAAAQPMHSLDGRFTIVLNGEIYNYIEIKEFLLTKAYRFKTTSDTEVLLNLYIHEGAEGLKRVDGMFAFAIWDHQKKELFCARDRFGEKPFFYHRAEQGFWFASETKALFAANIRRSVSTKHIYNYLLYGNSDNPCDLSETPFDGIQQLEAAHWMKIKADGHVQKECYWSVDVNARQDITDEEAVSRFRELFQTSVARRLRSDVPVGSSLSGGLDSSSIVMEVDRIKGKGQVQKTFSARFPGFVRDEGAYMEMVVSKTTAEPHYVYPSADSVMQHLQKIMYHQELPFGSTSIAAQYEVMKLARDNNIIVLLDGQGADETLAGYSNYWRVFFEELFYRNRALFNKERDAFLSLHGYTAPMPDMPRRLLHAAHISTGFIRQLRKKMIDPGSEYFRGIHPDIVRMHSSEASPFPHHQSLKEHLWFSTFKMGLSELLRYADRNAMAHSVEVRLPFLNHELVEFIFSLPNDLLIRNGWTKFILRRSMEDILPEKICWRKDKVGYEPPQQDWFDLPQYKKLFDDSVSWLREGKYILTPHPDMKWQYLMMYLMLSQKA